MLISGWINYMASKVAVKKITASMICAMTLVSSAIVWLDDSELQVSTQVLPQGLKIHVIILWKI